MVGFPLDDVLINFVLLQQSKVNEKKHTAISTFSLFPSVTKGKLRRRGVRSICLIFFSSKSS